MVYCVHYLSVSEIGNAAVATHALVSKRKGVHPGSAELQKLTPKQDTSPRGSANAAHHWTNLQ
jgi:hypothetical protein